MFAAKCKKRASRQRFQGRNHSSILGGKLPYFADHDPTLWQFISTLRSEQRFVGNDIPNAVVAELCSHLGSDGPQVPQQVRARLKDSINIFAQTVLQWLRQRGFIDDSTGQWREGIPSRWPSSTDGLSMDDRHALKTYLEKRHWTKPRRVRRAAFDDDSATDDTLASDPDEEVRAGTGRRRRLRQRPRPQNNGDGDFNGQVNDNNVGLAANRGVNDFPNRPATNPRQHHPLPRADQPQALRVLGPEQADEYASMQRDMRAIDQAIRHAERRLRIAEGDLQAAQEGLHDADESLLEIQKAKAEHDAVVHTYADRLRALVVAEDRATGQLVQLGEQDGREMSNREMEAHNRWLGARNRSMLLADEVQDAIDRKTVSFEEVQEALHERAKARETLKTEKAERSALASQVEDIRG